MQRGGKSSNILQQRGFDIWLQLFLSLISIDNGYDHLLHVCVHNKNVHVDKPTWEFLK